MFGKGGVASLGQEGGLFNLPHLGSSPVFTQNISLAGPPTLSVTHDGIFDVSSLLNAAPCHTGAAYPRRATRRAGAATPCQR